MTSPAAPDLSAREARRISLRAQGLLGPRLRGGPPAVLRRLRAVQLDTISVLARSHELVAYARLGPVPRRQVEHAYWGRSRGAEHGDAFEYWAHAACVIPMEDWPYFESQRAARRARGRRWHQLEDAERHFAEVRKKLELEGPLTARQLGGAKRGGPWWDWSEIKIAVERMLDVGDVVCTSRVGFQRVYDLPERAVPRHLLDAGVPEEDQVRHLLMGAARALGVATAADLGAYCGVSGSAAGRVAPELPLTPLAVEGWRRQAFADPEALAAPTTALRSRPVLLSPFDSTIWHRPRVEQVFGFRHRLEAYVPKPQRVHGYFSMPVLAGDSLVARVDPARADGALVARSVHLEPGIPVREASRGVAAALAEAATWVGAAAVVLERVEPAPARAAVEAAIAVQSARSTRRR